MMGLTSYFKVSRAKVSDARQVAAPDDQASTSNHAPSSRGSRSTFPPGDFRNSALLHDIRFDVMVTYLSKLQVENCWISEDCNDEGVILKKARSAYTCFPSDLMHTPDGYFDAVTSLNVRSALTVSNTTIRPVLEEWKNEDSIPLSNGLRLQVLPSMMALENCQKHQFAAVIADRGVLIVWDDEPMDLPKRASSIVSALINSVVMLDYGLEDEKKSQFSVTVRESSIDDDASRDMSDSSIESAVPREPRPLMFITPCISAITLCLAITCLSIGWKAVTIEMSLDGGWLRMAFLVALLPQIWLSLFFFQSIAGCIAQLCGPVSQMRLNTKYYSGKKPKRMSGPLPHVTIQMPVYKEGLDAVIVPTIRSIKSAISTYEMQGGTANIFVNDDGMQLISAEEASARQDFYDENNIGWIARPPHNSQLADGTTFLRRGKFKKASNMNYALWMSCRVEDGLSALDRPDDWSFEREAACYQEVFDGVIEDSPAWGSGNIRMGDYVLLIDSDTRVPEDCFLDAVSEMERSPEVAILQYSSGVMNVTNSYFERAITFFTNLVYTQICFAVSCGDVAPFVGHNAILRWSAVQEISYEEDGREKFWSEATVSEDFDMALRLQTAGYIVRLAAYQGDGFQEGVSLTVYDELARWEKYAYGCNELVFHPLRYWVTRGPFTKLFRRFIASSMPLSSKVTIMAYVGTYYAIGSAWFLSLLNYFVVGWFNERLDKYYINGFKVYCGVIVIFSLVGSVALAVLRYRIGHKSLVAALVENFTWVPIMSIFIGGLSLHVSQALLAHMFSIDMSWGATVKEAVDTTFFKELPKVLKQFKGTLIFCFATSAMMIALARFVPVFWRIDLLIAIYPLSSVVVSHFLLPIALNPGLMRFTW